MTSYSLCFLQSREVALNIFQLDDFVQYGTRIILIYCWALRELLLTGRVWLHDTRFSSVTETRARNDVIAYGSLLGSVPICITCTFAFLAPLQNLSC